ncbi:putative sporulation protein YtaF [Desulfosporosinus acidiphilus SJ4]|uniref:Putative sporulation protein YtaF n=1 Tax=Desulfosporosinus acidiphilus (strain DSM 22704 / JCM 16185 / SJ4) TaxID=646529 RepID=I4D1R9_DESAJ|nr:sporulation membrane protein YtaF [Desulfosporosinus acidiphilus]AFM39743.1 putative sporulation protein YtaF [Desulfosporosinus acidiphilus SJ4]
MHIMTALFVGLAANLDNFGVGVSYGVQKIRIPFLSNFFIALLSGLVTFAAVFTGHFLSHYITVANMIGAILIILIGIWVTFHKPAVDQPLPAAIPAMKTYSISIKPLSTIVKITKNPSMADIDANGYISAKEAAALGLTLSFNCIATGIGAGLTGLAPLPLAISVGLFSMVTISSGYWTGWKTASDHFERCSQILSGALLILIGIYELIN